MGKAAAWIMNVDETLFASVSQMELVHIINNPCYTHIPGAPDYCRKVIIWNDNILPVVDMSHILNTDHVTTGSEVVAVIIYRNFKNEIHYGGIVLSGSPNLEFVDNEQICKFPDHSNNLQDISLSCFTSKDGHIVPILDITKIFSRDYSLSYIRRHC